jgi:putative transposase
MMRDGMPVARCTVKRLMKRMGLHGVRRGKVVRTTVPDKAVPCPLDRVHRQFKADRPNQLRVSDFTYVSTWQGWLYVAFVIDVYARRIVGWRVSSPMRHGLCAGRIGAGACSTGEPRRVRSPLTHHSATEGAQYVSASATASALAEAGIEPSVGSKGDS